MLEKTEAGYAFQDSEKIENVNHHRLKVSCSKAAIIK